MTTAVPDGAIADRNAGSDAGRPAAPPVVAVVVVHEPGAWFVETLESLARQDYPNLNTLFLVAGGTTDTDGRDIGQRIRATLPTAFIRIVEGGPSGGPGFGPTANAVLDVVEGDSGFFCLCHDDVALAPDAIRLMVEELYRSNAGIVGPKLVSWDNARLLQDVGLDVDRFGEPASRVDPGEFDQEQADAVADVFAVPSACMLVRADLFRALGGFDDSMRFHGEDIDLGWRAHITGARVVVAPSARVRHRGELELRRPDLSHTVMRARNHMRSTMTLTAGSRLPLRMLELIGLTIVEVVLGVFAGRFSEAWAAVRALVGAVPRVPTYLARRGSIAKQRRVSDHEVHGLQSRGSNRLRSFVRAREMRTFIGVGETTRRWRDRSLAPIITWVVVAVAVLIASRSFISGSVPVIGEFLPFPSGAGDLWRSFTSGWNGNGLGATSPNPTGLATLAAGSVFWLFDMSLGLTALVVGLILLGGLGVWRLTDLFPSNRERVVALITYVAMPLVPGVVSTGRLGALVAFAAVPWFVHLLRVSVGIGTADPASAAVDLVDGIVDLEPRERVRRAAVLAIVAALAAALAPPVLVIFAGVVVVIALCSFAAGSGWPTAAWIGGLGLGACVVAWLLNFPASTTWSWESLSSVSLAGPTGRGLADVAAMDVGEAELGRLGLALYLPVVTGLLLARAWRLTWSARAAGLVVVFGALAVLEDRGDLPVRMPEVGFLLAPAALGLAIAAASAVSSFSSDVAGGTFGWRQPVGLLSVAAVGVGMFPSLLSITDGSWYAPTTTMAQLVETQIAPDDELGDFRVLYLGDPRLLPGAPIDVESGDGGFGEGIGMVLTEPGLPGIADRWVAPHTDADDALRAALADIGGNLTQRGGRLLAPFGIRYIVVPVYDGAVSTPDHPVDIPSGLLGALGAQLDLELRYSAPNYVLYENRSAYPAAALFTGAAAGSAAAQTPADLVRADLTSGTPALGTVLDDRSGRGTLEAGVFQLAVPFDDNWKLTVNGENVPARAGLGVMTAFDVPAAGPAELSYEQPGSRRNQLLLQAVLWVAALVVASRLRTPGWVGRALGRGSGVGSGEAAIELDELSDARPMGDDDPTRIQPRLLRPEQPFTPDTMGPLFGDELRGGPAVAASDGDERAAWVDEMFDDDDDDDDTLPVVRPDERGRE